jgi:hypothetical protein
VKQNTMKTKSQGNPTLQPPSASQQEEAVQFSRETLLMLFRFGCNRPCCNASGIIEESEQPPLVCKSCIGILEQAVEEKWSLVAVGACFNTNHGNKYGGQLDGQYGGKSKSLRGLPQVERWEEFAKYVFTWSKNEIMHL